MKELSQEEKSKRYDEAVREASIAYKDEDKHLKATLERIFPELKESEDEKIKREIIGFIRNAYWTSNRKRYNELVAWLEKKGERKETTYDEDMLGAIEYCKKNNRPLEKEHITWLEKQSEQKQKPTDKFHEGDWVVVSNVVYHIDKISGVYLTLSTLDGTALVYHISVLDSEHTHLWTISDVKPGDILADEDNNIGIYRGKVDAVDWLSYIYLGCDNHLYGFNIGGYHNIKNTKPATKEQRDEFEKAMADAGYTFDFEKKELNKIENNITGQNDDDERILNSIIADIKSSLGSCTNTLSGYYNEQIDWLKKLKTRIKL